MISILAQPLQRFSRFLDPKLISGMIVVGFSTVGIKSLAFVKELFVAHRFGTSDDVDAFLIAIMIPTVVAFIIGDACRDAVIPAFTERKINDPEGARRLVSNVIWCCAAMLVAVMVVVLLFEKPLFDLLAQNFSPEKKERGVLFLRLLAPFGVCFGLAAIVKSYLNTHGRFALASISAAAVPATIIIVLLAFPMGKDGTLLAIGASLGALIMLVIQQVATIRVKSDEEARPSGFLMRRPGWDIDTRTTLIAGMPLLAGAAIMEGCFVVDAFMAATLPAGSVAVLSYGERICSLVLTIGGTAAGEVLFPHLSTLAAQRNWKQLTHVSLRFSAFVLTFTLPFIALFWFASEPIVRLLLERGEFTPDDTERVAAVLRFAGMQIPGYILLVLASRLIIALRRNRVLLLVTILNLGLNVVANLIFMRWFGVAGIALATAIVSLVSAAMLFGYCFWRLRKADREAI